MMLISGYPVIEGNGRPQLWQVHYSDTDSRYHDDYSSGTRDAKIKVLHQITKCKAPGCLTSIYGVRTLD
jgi:hypothetical protein